MVIDDKYTLPIQYPVTSDGKTVLKKSDHIALVLHLQNLPTSQTKANLKEKRWNYNKENGWNRYKQLTEEETLSGIVEETEDVDEVAEKFDKKINKIKFKAFGKCTFKKENVKPKIAKLLREKAAMEDEEKRQEIVEEIAKEMTKEKYEAVERQLEIVKKRSKDHQTQAFKLRRIINDGGKEEQLEAILDHSSKQLLTNKEEILQATVQYAAGILQNNPSDVNFFKDHEATE